MAESLRLVGGAAVTCKDGVECGVVGRALVESVGKTVSHLAVEPRGFGGTGRLVPLNLVFASGDGICLDCSTAGFDALEPAEDTQRVVTSGMRPGSMSAPRLTMDRIPDGTVEVNSDTNVHATDGYIGSLQGFVVDPGDGRISSLLLEVGHFSKKRQISLPAAFVSSIAIDGIELTLSRSQVEAR